MKTLNPPRYPADLTWLIDQINQQVAISPSGMLKLWLSYMRNSDEMDWGRGPSTLVMGMEDQTGNHLFTEHTTLQYREGGYPSDPLESARLVVDPIVQMATDAGFRVDHYSDQVFEWEWKSYAVNPVHCIDLFWGEQPSGPQLKDPIASIPELVRMWVNQALRTENGSACLDFRTIEQLEKADLLRINLPSGAGGGFRYSGGAGKLCKSLIPVLDTVGVSAIHDSTSKVESKGGLLNIALGVQMVRQIQHLHLRWPHEVVDVSGKS